jgi:hypothetical protein
MATWPDHDPNQTFRRVTALWVHSMPGGFWVGVAGLFVVVALLTSYCAVSGQELSSLTSASGLRLVVVRENTLPMLRVLLPGADESDRTIHVIFPEHVTARRHGEVNADQLYLFRPGERGSRPAWHRNGRALEYEMTLTGAVRLVARATLDDDGVRFQYEFHNASDVAYDMIYAVTDPRLTGIFHDVRLERTYLHHADGFDLLASETPARLTLPLGEWLPARYRASFTWPIPAERVQRPGDGITYYDKSRKVDEPFLATRSTDGNWVIASFARDPGNVWSNPELTCQHVDPQVALPAKGEATTEIKMLVVRGTLEHVRALVAAQLRSLK